MSTVMVFPAAIRTNRLLLRSWRPGDARRLKEAIDANLAHLQAWLPWAVEEPSPPEVVAARVETFAADFAAGVEWLYAMFRADEPEVIGGTGLHPRIGADGLEIGYWVAEAHTRQGYATEAARALTRVAFTQPQIQRVQIRCDPNNLASAGVPRRLRFRHISTLPNDAVTPTGTPRETMVWELTRAEFESRSA